MYILEPGGGGGGGGTALILLQVHHNLLGTLTSVLGGCRMSPSDEHLGSLLFQPNLGVHDFHIFEREINEDHYGLARELGSE